jgi:predicted Rossmann-fold nucleotide-binding protein
MALGEEMDLPFIPIRSTLYTPEELLEGFDLADPSSLEVTRDFVIYRLFEQEAFGKQQSPYTSMMESLHDHFINQAAIDLLRSQSLIVGVMGGHDIARDEAGYRQVAELGRLLARKGALVVTGGGPGAMEAAHLGAALAHGSNADLDDAIVRLHTHPRLPSGLKKLVMSTGKFDHALRDQYHAWWRPAVELYRAMGPRIGTSLAMPTWYYGHETFTPFAAHIGKYFQNSMREDGLVTFCTGGVVYTPGSGGTLQEVFQDAAQNYYRSVGNRFSPMVFLGKQFWTTRLSVISLLRELFSEKDWASAILLTDSVDEAVDMLVRKHR